MATSTLPAQLEVPDHRRPRRDARARWMFLTREAALLAVAGLLYSLVRGLTNDRVDVAFANAEQVISLERGLGLFIEPGLQRWAVANDGVVHLANAVYIGYWPIIIGTLLWLLIRRPAAYPLYRTALLASGLLSLAVFALYPLAPPRFLPEHGFVDTIAAHSAGYRDFNASALVNEYAAMPSLHFGWVLLAAIAIGSLVRQRLVRIGAAALPLIMLAAIVLTGNHYLVDAVVGGVMVLGGLAVALVLTKIRTANERGGAEVPDPWPVSPR